MKTLSRALLVIALGTPALSALPCTVARAATTATATGTAEQIQSLRKELDALRASCDERLQALEKRLQEAESAAQSANAGQPPSSTSTAPSAPAPQAAAAGSANAFNPAMSLILSGGFTRTSQDPGSYSIAGFQLPTDSQAGPGPRGFNLAESELGLAANIDPWLRGTANIALEGDNSLSIEEAYLQTTSLGHGFAVKAGRFFSGVGYLNSQHSHTWDFFDNPLAYQALLGTQYDDDGVQVTWLAPTDQFIELGAEAARGRSFPGSDTDRNGAGTLALTAHTGGDIGFSNSWRAGISMLHAKANDQALTSIDAAGDPVNNAFTGSTQVWIVDGVWKWAPNGNAIRTNFKLQGEYLRSRRTGTFAYDVDGPNLVDAYRTTQSGWYLQSVYQFIPHWRVGARIERLDIGSTQFGSNSGLLAFDQVAPRKESLMLDFSPSEFSRLRLQFARDGSRGATADDQAILQYQMSLGAHGAHTY